MARLKVVTADDLRNLRELDLRVTECRASLKAGELNLQFTPAVPMALKAARDLEGEEEYQIDSGQTLELAAGGRLFLSHPDWELTVKSGEVNFERLSEEYNRTSEELQNNLERLGVKNLAEADKVQEAYSTQLNTIKALKSDLEEILAGQSYEDLEAAVGAALPKLPPWPSAEVALELGKVTEAIVQANKELAEKQNQLSQWQKTYQSLDHLVDNLADVRAEIKRLKKELASLTHLPPEVTDLAALISRFEEQESRLAQKQREWHDLLLDRVQLQSQAPGETAEEIMPQLREDERLFEETRRQGEALIAISQVFAEVEAGMDGQTLAPWIKNLEKILAEVTGGRYVTLEFDDQGPERAVRDDALKVPTLLLFGGAKVSFGLAVRLSMAAHFLHGLRGFLVMDDPLVDLDDSGRQEAAVQVIQKFAREKQVIILTCKQSHAGLLGGHRLDLMQ